MTEVVVIGDALIDELRTPSGSQIAAGGSALNVAVGLSILGCKATLIAMIGDDADGDALRRHLADFGVELLASPSPLGTGRAISDRIDGEPTYAFNAASQRRSIEFDEEIRRAIRSAAVIAVSGYPFDNSEQVRALLSATETVGGPLLVDPNPRSGMMTNREQFVENLLAFAARTDLLKLGDDDSLLLHSAHVSDAWPRYLEAGTRTVLATDGAKGATIHESSFDAHQGIAHDSRPIVDTMGAGDATFAAVVASTGQLGRLPSGSEWGTVLAKAMDIAAKTIRVSGGTLQH